MDDLIDDRAAELRLRYLEDQILMASPEQRLLMLFDGLGADLKAAEEAFSAGDLKRINDHLVHAQEILLALRDPLDASSEVGRALGALYTYFHAELVRANLEKDSAPIRPIAAMLERIAQANRAVASKDREPLAFAS